MVGGSGLELRPLLDEIAGEADFGAVLGDALPVLRGHERRFVWGWLGDIPLVLQCGRFHFYEGLNYEHVVRPVDALEEMGVRTIVFTNVAGALRPEILPGDLVAVTRLRTWRYAGWPGRPDVIETDFVVPGCRYDGEYMWMHGPSYETRAEIRALRLLGGAVVGMSTAPEVARCRERGIRAAVVSCVTNSCCAPDPLSHDSVVQAARVASGALIQLLRHGIPGAMPSRSAAE